MRLFTYIPELQRPPWDGSAMGQQDIVGFPNGSMLLRQAQPSDSSTYQAACCHRPPPARARGPQAGASLVFHPQHPDISDQ